MPTASEPTASASYAADVNRDFGPYSTRDGDTILAELRRQLEAKHAAEVAALKAEKRELETRLRAEIGELRGQRAYAGLDHGIDPGHR